MGISICSKEHSDESENELSIVELQPPKGIHPEKKFEELMESISLPQNDITDKRRKYSPYKFLSKNDVSKYTLVANQKISEGFYSGFLNEHNQPDYKGLLVFADLQIYEGEFNNGEITGLGRKFIDRDSMYEGKFYKVIRL